MKPWLALALSVGVALVLIIIIIVPEWRLPGPGRQLGWRASSMVQFAPPGPGLSADVSSTPLPAASFSDARRTLAAYKNVRVLTDVGAGEFMRTMTAMTQWVSPKQGCGFCHAGGDYASDAKPTKEVARLMLQMTRHINADWRDHVGDGGVTCQSCHRGQPIPSDVWFAGSQLAPRPMIDRQEDYHEDEKTVEKFFPNEGEEEYLLQSTSGSSQSYTALPTHSGSSQIVIKRLYEVMMQMSNGIGVNCGYCHNSRAFFDWRQSTPARWTGYSGIKMTRDLNRNYLIKTGAILPQSRDALSNDHALNLSPAAARPQPGNGLSDCGTCHHGAPQPFRGGADAKAYPALLGAGSSTTQAVAQAATPAPMRSTARP